MGQLDENQQDAVDNTPVDNQPGHHPDHEQDQPDLDEFAERLGVTSPDHHNDATDGSEPTDRREPGESARHDDDHSHRSAVLSAASAVASTAFGLAGRARDLAEPLGRAVSERVGRMTGAGDEYRDLTERIERLEAEIADLKGDSTKGGPNKG